MFAISIIKSSSGGQPGGTTVSACQQYREGWLSWVQLSSWARCSFLTCDIFLKGQLPCCDIVLVAGSALNTNFSPCSFNLRLGVINLSKCRFIAAGFFVASRDIGDQHWWTDAVSALIFLDCQLILPAYAGSYQTRNGVRNVEIYVIYHQSNGRSFCVIHGLPPVSLKQNQCVSASIPFCSWLVHS